ncbi:MAG: hypothetical protein D6724_06030 [Armatimonadetes bacterium]|nr:MAG: hypothetical protein D6724_06030 [Armatimonadota bacterium]
MKHLFALFAVLIVVAFAAIGCGGSSDESADTNAVSTDQATTKQPSADSNAATTATDDDAEEHAEGTDDDSEGHESAEKADHDEDDHKAAAKEDKPKTAEKAPSKPQSSSPAGKSAALDAALISTGKQKFETVGCMNCHSVGGKGGKTAPDLSRVGAEHGDAEFYMKLLLDPASMGKEGMPSFAHVPEADRRAIAEYLRSLR